MSARLVALDEGADIPLDRTMVVVGRHPQCDARLDSLRVSRHHCCMTLDNGEVVVRDLGSTNGIRINGQRVEIGRLKAGDELSIAHIRYRLDKDSPNDKTLVDPGGGNELGAHAALLNPLVRQSNSGNGSVLPPLLASGAAMAPVPPPPMQLEQPLMDALREHLPAGMADKYRIQVIVKMDPSSGESEAPAVCRPDSSQSL